MRYALVALVGFLAVPADAAPLRFVRDTGIEGVCAVTGAGAIVCEQADVLPIDAIRARDFAPSYHPVVVREDGSVVRVRRGDHDTLVLAVPFKAKSAGIVGSPSSFQLCAVGEKGELACGPFPNAAADKNVAFTTFKGRFVDVRFDHEAAWALDDKGALWCIGSSHCARAYAAANESNASAILELADTWPGGDAKLQDAPLFRVSEGVKRMYVGGTPCVELASDAASLVCWSSIAPQKYRRPKADEIISMGVWTCARVKTSVTCEYFGEPRAKPFTFAVEPGVKMHYLQGGRKLCIETAKAELRCSSVGPPMGPFETIKWATRQPPKNDP